MPDTEPLSAFVNERRVRVPAPSTALAAVRALDPALALAVVQGRAYLTDGRGIRCRPEAALAEGAILRVVLSARRAPEPDAQP